jgi:hypothetical protein
MNDALENEIWHYGLMAEKWAAFSHDTPELDFLQGWIEKIGQPVLDLACGTIYFKHEMLLMLQTAGFNDISVYGDYTDQAATADSEELVFVARK